MCSLLKSSMIRSVDLTVGFTKKYNTPLIFSHRNDSEDLLNFECNRGKCFDCENLTEDVLTYSVKTLVTS